MPGTDVSVEIGLRWVVHTILVVDANVTGWSRCALCFSEEGYRVFIAGTKEEAAEMAEDRDIDLVILDFNVSGLVVMDLLAVFRSRDIPVIVHTATDDPPEEVSLWSPEAWMPKTGACDPLRTAIAEALKRRDERGAERLREEVPTIPSDLCL
ncbi:MAG: response regulator [Planctomycetota bacterium]|jgi:DNA-binding response OmpR family regulator